MPGPFLRERLSTASFLESVRPLQTLRYFCFVLCYSASLALAVALLFATAFRLVFGGGDPRQDQTRLLLTIGLTTVSGAFGGWLLKLSRSEEMNIAEQESRELQRHRFNADEDQRRIDNSHVAELFRMADSLPVKSRERIVSDCLGRLLQGQQRQVRRSAVKAATG